MATAKKAWNTREKLDREDSATRAQLLRAARSVFEQRGYARTAIADITAAAEVSRATFYVYFASKEAVFGVLAGEVRDRFLAAQELDGLDAEDPYAVAEATIAAYLDAYVENLAFLTVLEHQAITDPAMYALREEIHTAREGAVRATSRTWRSGAWRTRWHRRRPWPPRPEAWSRSSPRALRRNRVPGPRRLRISPRCTCVCSESPSVLLQCDCTDAEWAEVCVSLSAR
ncbi:TetR/AcrR family transcriptional regulator [Streptomyces sp. F001]|uniref:TetR/AcrR family transcriptional regulator n=1 Tax=Streptomyces sp. F001 TaxID=1510026 RepID=UPI00101E78F9|nr:TetR/AcrR family transcriptional regulator [Streptomyces sp. F001]RZB14207.1 TetR/AcrR family transcriptional regulator [Streptomyces sp. F001]